MKKELHPDFKETVIHCACGESFPTRSTGDEMRVEVCSNCHPFYTGKTRKASRGGRVERFQKKYGLKVEEDED